MNGGATDQLVATARAADRQAWSHRAIRVRREALQARNAAIRQALADGVPEQHIADALGVRLRDVTWMAR
jgi:FixJ family two-component response regulator